jgi:UDP-glucose 4-epimerase
VDKFLVTGGAGFFGDLLIRALLDRGDEVVSIDKNPHRTQHPRLTTITANLCNDSEWKVVFDQHTFRAVYHCAAVLGHSIRSTQELWSTNLYATERLFDLAQSKGVGHFVFLSTNCLWGDYPGRPVREDDPPCPIEIYGHSKASAETALLHRAAYEPTGTKAIVLRCPTIMDEGRLGLFTLLFDLVRENRTLWMIGDGSNRYQFVYAADLVQACLLALNTQQSDIFNLGSDHVPTLRQVYAGLIAYAGSQSRIRVFPKALGMRLLNVGHSLGLSPLGPYHVKMIAGDFQFCTQHAKQVLGWSPTLTNTEMLVKAYAYYIQSYDRLKIELADSEHFGAVKWGALKLVRFFS